MPQQIATIRTGDVAPSNSVGVDGDVFINTSNSNVYTRVAGVYINNTASATARQYASSGNFGYCGTAPAGSLQASAVWSITRLTYDSAGNVTAKACATNVAWTNYLSVVYSTCV